MFGLLAAFGCAPAPDGRAASDRDRPVIVLVTFGTSVEEARQVYEHIDRQARRRYPEHDIRWAYTSEFIVRKLRKRGETVRTLDEVIADLRSDGVRRVALQSLHVVPGQKHHELKALAVPRLQVAVGAPLLATKADIRQAIGAVEPVLKEDRPNVFAMHGNDKHPEYNRELVAFSQAIREAHDNVYCLSVEGQPGLDQMPQVKKAAARAGAVHFVPLMIVAGDHVMNDVMGDEEASWKSVVDAEKTTCAKPLGYNEKILAIYFGHLDAALAKLAR
jgi:sirohydrochlorin cobaltochelatase